MIKVAIAQEVVGDPIAGKEKSKFCQSCHGQDGNSINVLCPNLAGQRPDYLEKQILDFQTRNRIGSIMTGVSQSIISPQDAKDIAAYFGSCKPMSSYNVDKVGRTIFREGIPDKEVTACVTCHGENGKGRLDENASYPVIGGQTKDYIAKQLMDLRSGYRHNDPDGMMRNIAKKLTDDEIKALADYVSEL
jgi:cytochrome c553